MSSDEGDGANDAAAEMFATPATLNSRFNSVVMDQSDI
jgi:hypothetical protein